MNYWLDLFNGTTWDEFRNAGATVSGFPETQRRTSEELRSGDILLCYVTGVKRWVGALEFIGPSEDDARVWRDGDYPVRVSVRPVITLDAETGLPMDDLEGLVSFYDGPDDRGSYRGMVRQSLRRIERCEDGDRILELLQEAARKPTRRPVDQRKLYPRASDQTQSGSAFYAGTSDVLDQITREDLERAFEAHERGEWHKFTDSTIYDVVHNGKRYPPKAIVRLAASFSIGRSLEPDEFSGASGRECFKVLERHGFKIVSKESGVPPRQLPEIPTGNAWIEMTKSSHHHGGAGWEYGTCLWSPSRAKRGGREKKGKDSYVAMREALPGDLVIHCQDSQFTGFSLVKEAYREVSEEPPSPGQWRGMAPYYRVNLHGYTPLNSPLPLASFMSTYASEIRDDLRNNQPVRYPFFATKQGRIQTVQGGYLTKCTSALYEMIRASMLEGITQVHVQQEVLPYSIDDALDGLFLPRITFESIIDALKRKKNVIIQGPPGVGKTFVAQRVAFTLIGVLDRSRMEMVQFHQSYSYEDFVQGWRPKADSGFELRSGPFCSFCKHAQSDTDGDFVFIIDEINRGNLSRIFGESMMLIEHDKRGADFAIPLTYSSSGDRFFVPSNVHLLGLMNTADRSLAMVDYALRRRFVFVTLEPMFSTDMFRTHLQERGVSDNLIDRIVDRMETLNEIIGKHKDLGMGFRIGHSFFCPVKHDETLGDEWYRTVVETEIAPLLREYWFDAADEAEGLIAKLLA